ESTGVTDEMRQVLRGPAWTDRTPHLAFSPDSRRFAATAADGTVKVWDTETLRVAARFPGEARTVAFSIDGQEVLTETYEGNRKRWDLTREELRMEVPPAAKFENWAMTSMTTEERVAFVAARAASTSELPLSEIPSSRDRMVAGALASGG